MSVSNRKKRKLPVPNILPKKRRKIEPKKCNEEPPPNEDSSENGLNSYKVKNKTRITTGNRAKKKFKPPKMKTIAKKDTKTATKAKKRATESEDEMKLSQISDKENNDKLQIIVENDANEVDKTSVIKTKDKKKKKKKDKKAKEKKKSKKSNNDKKSKHKKSKKSKKKKKEANNDETEVKEENNRNYAHFTGINGYKLKYFCLLSKPNKIMCEKPTKLMKLHRIDRLLKELNDDKLFSEGFKTLRAYDIKDEDDELLWENVRSQFMNECIQRIKDRKLWNEFVELLSVVEFCWNHKHRERPIVFRWPINEQIEDKLTDEIKDFPEIKIKQILTEIFGEKEKETESQSNQTLYDLFYDKYLAADFEQILKGPGFGRWLYLYNFQIPQKDDDNNNDDDMDADVLKEELKTANNGEGANVIRMVRNLNNRSAKRDKQLLSVNAILQNKTVRESINSALIDADKEQYYNVLQSIEAEIDAKDAYRPKDKDNENVYIFTEKRMINVHPKMHDSDAVKEWIANASAESVYSCYGFINYGYVELGAFDDLKSYFLNKIISHKKFCILKLKLDAFNNWNNWTNANWDRNSNCGDNVDQLYRSLLGPSYIIPIKVEEIKVGKKKVLLYECEVASHTDIFTNVFQLSINHL